MKPRIYKKEGRWVAEYKKPPTIELPYVFVEAGHGKCPKSAFEMLNGPNRVQYIEPY